MLSSSCTIISRSIQVFWRQNICFALPCPELDEGLFASGNTYQLHFHTLHNTYGDFFGVNLVNKHGIRPVTDHYMIDDYMTNNKSTGSVNNHKIKQSRQSSLLYSFNIMRINHGGEKQAFMAKFQNNVMQVAKSDGLCIKSPLYALMSWEKALDGDGSIQGPCRRRRRCVCVSSFARMALVTV